MYDSSKEVVRNKAVLHRLLGLEQHGIWYSDWPCYMGVHPQLGVGHLQLCAAIPYAFSWQLALWYSLGWRRVSALAQFVQPCALQATSMWHLQSQAHWRYGVWYGVRVAQCVHIVINIPVCHSEANVWQDFARTLDDVFASDLWL